MAHTIYENFVLQNQIADQLNSLLDLQKFCKVDNSLVGTPGMEVKINVYTATNGTEKLNMGEGNTKDIEVSYAQTPYKILLAQNRFPYFDEQEMIDPKVVETGVRHSAVNLYNTMNADIHAEFAKATQTVTASAFDFGAFVDAIAALGVENPENTNIFAFVHPDDMAAIRKVLKDDLKFVEAFARTGYVGSVAGVKLFSTKEATAGVICGGTSEAVTLFHKKGVEVEQARDSDLRKNTIFSRKYYLAALTDATKVFKIVKG